MMNTKVGEVILLFNPKEEHQKCVLWIIRLSHLLLKFSAMGIRLYPCDGLSPLEFYHFNTMLDIKINIMTLTDDY